MTSWRSSPLLNELRTFLPAYVTLFAFSFFCPVLYLASPIYVEQLFDRVMYSRNVNTLVVLTVIATFLLAMYAVLEWVRKRALGVVANAIDERLSRTIFTSAIRGAGSGRAALIMSDFNTVRDFLGGPQLLAIFDAVWSPLFIIVMTLVSPVFGIAGVAILGLIALLAALNHRLTRGDIGRYQRMAMKAQEFSQSVARNSETVRALGMLPRLRERWYGDHLRMLGWQTAAAERIEIFTSATKFVRAYQMVGIFAIGTVLYLNNEVTLSNTFIAMTMMMRGLGPIDQVISNWKSYLSVWGAVGRIDEVLHEAGQRQDRLSLPGLSGPLTVSRLYCVAPGGERPLLSDVSFALGEGRVLGVIGPSGAGKSCLARTLVGAWTPRSGSISIGDHDQSHWDEDERGHHLGYMPQDIELLPGTVAENIARFDPLASPDAVIAAAELAGIQDLIRSLPDGYNTLVGPNGTVLSGGQRSRIALARAVYGEPGFIVLDEPNANLDAMAEQALLAMVQKLRNQGRTIVIVTHKLNILSCCDDVLLLNNGTVQAFGPRDQIVSRMARPATAPALTVVARALESRR